MTTERNSLPPGPAGPATRTWERHSPEWRISPVDSRAASRARSFLSMIQTISCRKALAALGVTAVLLLACEGREAGRYNAPAQDQGNGAEGPEAGDDSGDWQQLYDSVLDTMLLADGGQAELERLQSRARALPRLAAEEYGAEHVNVGDSHVLLGILHLYGIEPQEEEALDHFRTALEIYRQSSPPDPARLADALNRIGSTLITTSKTPEEAVAPLNEAISLLHEHRGDGELHAEDIASVLTSLEELLRAYRIMRDYQGLAGTYERKIDLLKQHDSNDRTRLARLFKELARAYRWERQHEDALDALNRKRELEAEIYDAEHLRIAETYLEMALTHDAAGDREDAVRKAGLARQTGELAVGPQEVQWARTLFTVAEERFADGDFVTVAVWYEEAVHVLSYSTESSDEEKVSIALSRLREMHEGEVRGHDVEAIERLLDLTGSPSDG